MSHQPVFFYMTKKSRQKIQIFLEQKELLRQKAFIIIFKELSLKQLKQLRARL